MLLLSVKNNLKTHGNMRKLVEEMITQPVFNGIMFISKIIISW